ncbi:MAG TPA: thioredoxin-disulfide reductase [Syntrophales bacterium]|nr:thioredoxin-disulfide reductase [Syntrophales bacterium]
MVKHNIPDHIYDIVIIGGGPAGLTAGLYAARAGLKTLLFEGVSSISQITVTDLIENYPGIPEGISGFELIERFKKQASQFGLEVLSNDVISITRRTRGDTETWEVKTEDIPYESLAIIIATGAYWRKLGVLGEDAFVGKGVSYCATCDGPLFKNRDVVVVGGGDAAVQEAIFLTNFARKVTIVHRRDCLRATKNLQKRAFANSKIEFAWNSVVEEISGADFVEKIKIRNVKSSDVTMEMPAAGVFIFTGLIPKTDIVHGVVDLDSGGYIIVDENMQTSAKGIFAGGDCIRKSLRQVITACGDGATAAFSAQHYVEELKGESY